MTNEEIRLDRYFAAVWRAKWLITIGVLLAGGLAAFLGFNQPTSYTAAALIEVGRVWKEPLEDPYLTTEIANGAGFSHELSEKTGLKPNYLKRSINAETVTGGPRRSRYPILVRILATTESSDESVRLAQAAADEIIARHEKLFNEALAPHLEHQRRLERRAEGAAPELALMIETELGEVKANNTSPTITQKSRLVDPASAGAAIRPAPWRNVGAAALLAAIVGVAAAVVIEHFKPVGRTEDARRAERFHAANS